MRYIVDVVTRGIMVAGVEGGLWVRKLQELFIGVVT